MEIRFYKIENSSKKNAINKTLPSEYVIINGEFRDSVDISNPTIVIDISSTANIDAVASTDARKSYLISQFKINNFNYVYIPLVVSRYYFVKKITLLRKNILSIELHVDVLMSFKPFIYNQTAFVTRNQTDYHIELPDERRIITNDIEISDITLTKTLTSDYYTDFDTTFGSTESPEGFTHYNIIASVFTDEVNSGFIMSQGNVIHNPLPAGELDIIPEVRAGNFQPLITKNYMLNRRETALLIDYVTLRSETQPYLTHIFAYPIDFKSTNPTVWPSRETDFKIFDQLINSETVHFVRSEMSGLILNTSFILDDTIVDFNDLEPYSQYELYIPYYGYYALDYNALRGHELYLFYVINYMDGSATVQLYDNTADILVMTKKCQLGIEIPKLFTNITDVRNRHEANNTSLGFGLIASALSIFAGLATGGAGAVLGVAGGLIAGAKTVGSYAINEKTNIMKGGVSDSDGNTSPLFAPQIAYIRKKKRQVLYSLTSDFLANNGGVLNELRQLNTLTGYTEIGDIPNINYGIVSTIPTDTEVDEIISILKSGVIF